MRLDGNALAFCSHELVLLEEHGLYSEKEKVARSNRELSKLGPLLPTGHCCERNRRRCSQYATLLRKRRSCRVLKRTLRKLKQVENKRTAKRSVKRSESRNKESQVTQQRQAPLQRHCCRHLEAISDGRAIWRLTREGEPAHLRHP